ncbi:NDP-sugar epimerase, includes UDP-GlcNAc-inverting 4,6-dehydratase FlaA1 and capsular polysaccharide biosynthesis protein EpsC [Tranquillimonas rosea]|uniref:NDP-sugar epimerase, includes UDP-GlcNAc-inverting 4,6-dehydratase FlaA1 and capsular polysaccharide biosynthesis protein EpsC n=1 Tax=Tranquillimonas rosea TaxID=641238 RepID=A0A1H9WBK3_9RHOB|nr:nucleoside-diphosphate sugar epimerase/dehydratase [Tranquillimonas rosea]SES31322.1 NDP-sugar epimerase, includes UDP-GlcNAc-inverting 4,6-dehydratase FlaA1 and capsular polysaccharide biosynthesis protein EpsC [Tranquillimonas rosea]
MSLISSLFLSMSRAQKCLAFLCVDVLLVPVAYLVTLAVQPNAAVFDLMMPQRGVMLLLLMVLTAALSRFLRIPDIRLNNYDLRCMGRLGVLAILVAACSMALHANAAVMAAIGTHVVFGIVYFLLLAASRVVMLELVLAIYRRTDKRRRVLIYGAGTTGMQLVRALAADRSIEPVAFVDDNSALQGLRVAGLKVLRPVDLPHIVAELQVDRVLLAMPSLSLPKQTQIARRLERNGLEVQALPSFAQLIGEEALIDKMMPIPPARLLGRAAVDPSLKASAKKFARHSVLVTGGGGSIGLELCRQVLSCKPRKLVIFEISEFALYEAEKALAPLAREAGTEIVSILGSVTEPRLVRHVLAEHGVEVVLHAAAYKHVPMVEQNPLVGLANNVLGTWTLARESEAAGVGRFILVSSDKAVRPTNIMGASKRLAEMVVQDLAKRAEHTVFAMVRFGNVLGSSGSVIPLFQEQIANGGPVTITHPEVTRFFMTQKEAVSLVLLAGSFAEGGEVFVLDMGKPMKIVDLARQVISDAGYAVRDDEHPEGDIDIHVTGLRPGEKLHEELLIGEGHLTTAHEKIFAAREDCLSELEVAAAIRALREAVASGNEAAARALVTRWVDGYVAPEVADSRGA